MDAADYAELRRLCQELMRRRTQEASQCMGKQKFDNRVDAQRSIRPRVRDVVCVYRCGICNKYHVGGMTEQRKWEKAQRRMRCE